MSKKETKTRFPVARIKKIMQADEDIGKVAQATPIVVAKALELFMTSLIIASCDEAKERNHKRVLPGHLKIAVSQHEEFDFLGETVAKYPDLLQSNSNNNNNNSNHSHGHKQ